ncbi:MAG: GNAT family N-acetyltransferase [Opitutales bacterium]|nr:GNAT family N-acetyltransferase [Opitutales bacterium]NRA26565.1 GNAT family N-acetyltransferase [Opitutales bacterium]
MEIIKADFASKRDAEAIVYLVNEYALDEMGGGQSLSDFTKENLISELSKRPSCAVFIAYVKGEAAGIAICFEVFSTFKCKLVLNIHDAVVVKKFRGQGLARALFEAVERFAITSGCCKMTLEVLEGNTVAQQAYRNFGFSGYELDPKMGNALFFEKELDLRQPPIIQKKSTKDSALFCVFRG